MTTATCAWSGCGRSFEAARANARYCSPNCRARASKDRRRAEGEPEAEAPEASAKPARPKQARPEPPRATAAGPEPAKQPPKSGPDRGLLFKDGAPANAWERFLALEERLDDLEYYGKQDWERKVEPLPDRLAKLEARVPTEAKIKEWSKEEALEAIHVLRERLEELEHTVNGPDGLVNLDPAHAALERRVASLEDPNDVGDASVRIKVRRLEKALVDEINCRSKLNQDITKLATLVNGIMDLIG